MISRSLRPTWVLLILSILCVTKSAFAQSACSSEVQSHVFTNRPGSTAAVPVSQSALRNTVDQLRVAPAVQSRGLQACVIAELLKRLGDTSADRFYREAVTAEPDNGEFRLLYGDYLRNYRGPEQPLVDAAATQYYAGLRTADVFVANQIRRSLIALFERDGISIGVPIDRRRPFSYFSTQNLFDRSPDDQGNVDTLRTLTAGALFAESASRLNRPLTSAEALALIRNSPRVDTIERLRVRYRTLAIDVSWQRRFASNAQPTNFFQTERQNDVTVTLSGVGVEYVTSAYPLFDVMLRADFKDGSRTGLIEFQPDAEEGVRSLEGQAVVSRFLGPNKINIELLAGHDWIDQHVAIPIERHVERTAATVRYQIFQPLLGSLPYERPIAARGSELFGGVARTVETYGTVDVFRHDVFGGVSFKGLPGGGEHSFDVTIQPTLFTSTNRDRLVIPIVDSSHHAQLETFGTLLYRVVDRENVRNVEDLTPLAFLNIVGLVSAGAAREGPAYFDRTRAGVQLDAKLIGRANGGMTWLLSGRYEVQHFSSFDHTYNVVSGMVNLGF